MLADLADRETGNLPTEKVTKRDLFHIFHKHGKLAQVSLKQAYGFVQFLEATSCYDALSNEQGVAIRGRKIREAPCPALLRRSPIPTDLLQTLKFPNLRRAAVIQAQLMPSPHLAGDLGRPRGGGMDPIVDPSSNGYRLATFATSLLGGGMITAR